MAPALADPLSLIPPAEQVHQRLCQLAMEQRYLRKLLRIAEGAERERTQRGVAGPRLGRPEDN